MVKHNNQRIKELNNVIQELQAKSYRNKYQNNA